MPQYFIPRNFYIDAITTGPTTIIQTTLPMNYVVGQEIRLVIPQTYGAQAINMQQGLVISIPAPNQVEVSIYSVGIDPFIPSPTYGPTSPQIIPIGDINNGWINKTGRKNTLTYIPGSFINVSPGAGQVTDPFPPP